MNDVRTAGRGARAGPPSTSVSSSVFSVVRSGTVQYGMGGSSLTHTLSSLSLSPVGGVHRRLGVHTSQVRSINMDKWLPEQMDAIRSKGNVAVNAVYEANLPPGTLVDGGGRKGKEGRGMTHTHGVLCCCRCEAQSTAVE